MSIKSNRLPLKEIDNIILYKHGVATIEASQLFCPEREKSHFYPIHAVIVSSRNKIGHFLPSFFLKVAVTDTDGKSVERIMLIKNNLNEFVDIPCYLWIAPFAIIVYLLFLSAQKAAFRPKMDWMTWNKRAFSGVSSFVFKTANLRRKSQETNFLLFRIMITRGLCACVCVCAELETKICCAFRRRLERGNLRLQWLYIFKRWATKMQAAWTSCRWIFCVQKKSAQSSVSNFKTRSVLAKERENERRWSVLMGSEVRQKARISRVKPIKTSFSFQFFRYLVDLYKRNLRCAAAGEVKKSSTIR